MKREMTITLKLYSGLHKELTREGYDPSRGVALTVAQGTRLKGVLKELRMQKPSSNAYFRNGERIGLWTKLRDGDEVSCLRPSGGG
ncbi:MAG: MoaD/ThiS family protein [Spirochaetes bacterium]|nr:MoaD/ThiS family protein [Spirochaetota bacterium]